jgi:hypothetical protein
VPAPRPDDPGARELALWDAVKDSRDAGSYALYLERYPDGRFAEIARARTSSRAVTHSGKSFSFSREEARLDREWAARTDPWARAANLQCTTRAKGSSIRINIDAYGGSASQPASQLLAARLRNVGFQIVSGAADYQIAGTIVVQRSLNRQLDLQELAAAASITLGDAGGREVASAVGRAESYAGSNPSTVESELVRESVEEAGARLYSDFCAAR